MIKPWLHSRLMLACVVMSSTVANAGFLGLSGIAVPAVETTSEQGLALLGIGYSNGKLDAADYRYTGLRVEYQVLSQLTVFADLGNAKIGRRDNTAYGAGVVIPLDAFVNESISGWLRGSIHVTDVTSGFRSTLGQCTTLIADLFGNLTPVSVPCTTGGSRSTAELRVLSLEAVRSQQLQQFSLRGNQPATWFASVGIQAFDGALDTTELSLGVGLSIPYGSNFSFGFSAEHIEEVFVSVGATYRLP